MDIFNLLESLGGELPETKKEKVQENTAKSAKMPDSNSKLKQPIMPKIMWGRQLSRRPK